MSLDRLKLASESFWYLATPYSKYPTGIEEAFRVACRATGKLILAGVPVYSPIAHTHPIAIYGGIDPFDYGIWIPADAPMMRAAHGLIVLKLPTWEISYGISEEIKEFSEAGKPIEYLDPEDL